MKVKKQPEIKNDEKVSAKRKQIKTILLTAGITTAICTTAFVPAIVYMYKVNKSKS